MKQEHKARMFEAMHVNTFILPNAWDVASARIFEEEKFPAVGTTSAGVAFSLGYRDGQRIPPSDMLAAIRRIASALDVPVTADIEAGYGDPVATAEQAWECGAVGINLEDVTGEEESTQVPLPRQVEVIQSIKKAVPNLFLNARTDTFLKGIGVEDTRLTAAIERLRAYRQAGADCLFAPGVKDPKIIAELVAAVDGPLNMLAGPGFPTLAGMKDLGVKRVSVGSGAMRACLGLITRIARELQTSGTYQAIMDGQYPYSEANRLLERKL
ncbi:MAG: isocitrate lyase/phosphoenolpyruvate mutase family protein [Bryobacteraceae bacterium]